MRSLVRALLTIPHGNSDAERVFSVLTDIATDKRNSLGAHSTQVSMRADVYFMTQRLLLIYCFSSGFSSGADVHEST